jgi:hypothetical protein
MALKALRKLHLQPDNSSHGQPSSLVLIRSAKDEAEDISGVSSFKEDVTSDDTVSFKGHDSFSAGTIFQQCSSETGLFECYRTIKKFTLLAP